MHQIIYVWNYRDWGGAQIYFMSLMKEARRSYSVKAVIPSDSEPKILSYLRSIDVPVEFLPAAPDLSGANGVFQKFTRHLSRLKSEYRLASHLLKDKEIANKILHIDLGFWQSFLPLFRLSRKTNVFMTVHTGLSSFTGLRGLRWKIKGSILSKARRFHLMASNKEAKLSLKPYLSRSKFDQIEIAYSGFDTVEIQRALHEGSNMGRIRDKYRLPVDRPILSTVGQFIERKGCWILLETLRQMKDEGKKFTFLWLSTALPDIEVLERIGGFGLGDSFRVLGPDEIGETRDELLTLLSIADMFVLASLQEGLPIALVEAMALGLPCVATDVNAIPEAIEDGLNGRLIHPGDPIELKNMITQLLNDPEQREQLGTAAKRTAHEQFDERITAAHTVKLYNSVWKTIG